MKKFIKKIKLTLITYRRYGTTLNKVFLLEEEIKQIMQEEINRLNDSSKWEPEGRKKSFDIINHVLRVLTQSGEVSKFKPQIYKLLEMQHEDGGFGEYATDTKSEIRETAFILRNLITVNRKLKDPKIDAAVRRIIDYLISKQSSKGTWKDSLWGEFDATSICSGALMFAVKEGIMADKAKPAVDRALKLVKEMRSEDGGWYDPLFKQEVRKSPVAWTGHLLPKFVMYYGNTPESRQSIKLLADAQEENGSWDNNDTDHTCDAVRAIMVCCELTGIHDYDYNIDKAIEWIVNARNSDGGWGTELGAPSNILMTCDVLDSFAKYLFYLKKKPITKEQFLAKYDDF